MRRTPAAVAAAVAGSGQDRKEVREAGRRSPVKRAGIGMRAAHHGDRVSGIGATSNRHHTFDAGHVHGSASNPGSTSTAKSSSVLAQLRPHSTRYCRRHFSPSYNLFVLYFLYAIILYLSSAPMPVCRLCPVLLSGSSRGQPLGWCWTQAVEYAAAQVPLLLPK